MKIAVATLGESLDAPYAPYFGRAANFIIYDTVAGTWDIYPNPALHALNSFGVKAAEFLITHDVQVVISGNFGAKAARTLAGAGIQMFLASRTIHELLLNYQQGQLKQYMVSSEVETHPQEVLPDPAWEGY